MRGFEIEELFICQCGDPSHQFIIAADKETTDRRISATRDLGQTFVP